MTINKVNELHRMPLGILCTMLYQVQCFQTSVFSVGCLVTVSAAMALNGRMTGELYIGKD